MPPNPQTPSLSHSSRRRPPPPLLHALLPLLNPAAAILITQHRLKVHRHVLLLNTAVALAVVTVFCPHCSGRLLSSLLNAVFTLPAGLHPREGNMDRSWMREPKFSKKYVDGVVTFMRFVREHFEPNTNIRCPCINCLNVYIEGKHHLMEYLSKGFIDFQNVFEETNKWQRKKIQKHLARTCFLCSNANKNRNHAIGGFNEVYLSCFRLEKVSSPQSSSNSLNLAATSYSAL